MGIMSRNRRAGQAGITRDLSVSERDLGYEALGRHEAEAFAAPTRHVDPYAAWLERREDEQDRDRGQIRWVYRAPASRAGDDGGEKELVGTR